LQFCPGKPHNQRLEIVKIANDFITLTNFDHLLSQILTKFNQLRSQNLTNFCKVWPSTLKQIFAILTNFDQLFELLGGGGRGREGCYTTTPPVVTSLVSDISKGGGVTKVAETAPLFPKQCGGSAGE
jgi:hypothetical protein